MTGPTWAAGGRWIEYELMITDVAAATTFYDGPAPGHPLCLWHDIAVIEAARTG